MIIEAGSSPAGQQLAAETAEVVFTAAASLEEGQAFYRSQKNTWPTPAATRTTC